jgi:hypothetical protein
MELFREHEVVEFAAIRAALDDASRATAFRYLARVPYRRSYNHNGRFYIRHDPQQYDRRGLYSVGDIHFSRDGSLKATVLRLVQQAEAGLTQREVQDLVRARVQPFLLAGVRAGEIAREHLARFFLYVHADPAIHDLQMRHRRELIAGREATGVDLDLSDAVIIQVLLVLIRHPGSRPADVVRRLRGHAPPIRLAMVQQVFARYGLDVVGEKGGPARS